VAVEAHGSLLETNVDVNVRFYGQGPPCRQGRESERRDE
jgi:hypothetical protein